MYKVSIFIAVIMVMTLQLKKPFCGHFRGFFHEYLHSTTMNEWTTIKTEMWTLGFQKLLQGGGYLV
jgi:predicted hydrocarbon binding protein